MGWRAFCKRKGGLIRGCVWTLDGYLALRFEGLSKRSVSCIGAAYSAMWDKPQQQGSFRGMALKCIGKS